ncbi:uncharacterized threonine-rich GPI-anchored glycoprotein PJ4664.02-like [Stegodyphus dumicola]|uniref:uncharacterized threonine-rich GPI-anchored glycoprotein PJ4664.02-like n=1 Tax=Stegodyphus dumicola TaxID=202533 RepID=UPI0015ABE66E|nr:uncharacterized threonine-rich GPI-anchored glycoprotein PJ4664.02-like [Stegodyphus dumicola]
MTADGKKMLLPILAVIAVHLWAPTGGHVINRRASSTFGDEINHQRGRSYIANETLCIVDDKVYQRGDPVPADDHCERCTCRPPGFSCVLRDCHVKPGCKAVRQVGECCPEYICGCWHNNKEYKNGEIIRDLQNACYTCRCHGSSISCTFADCLYRTDCQPEYVQGECCPRYDHCPPLSTSTIAVTPSTTTPGVVQQEITFINITTQHLQKFTAEDTTVSIEEITPVVSSTTTPATESTRFSVKFTLTSEKAESSTPLPLQSVGFTETTRYVTSEEFSSSRTGLLDENISSVSDSGTETAFTRDSTSAETAPDNLSAINIEDIKYDSTTDRAFETFEELEAEETKSSIYPASETSLPQSVSLSEETHDSSDETYSEADSSTTKSESTVSVTDESSQFTRSSETPGDIQLIKQEDGTEQHVDESTTTTTTTTTVSFIQSHTVTGDESSYNFEAVVNDTTHLTEDINHTTEKAKEQDDATELTEDIDHATELIKMFDISTELTEEVDNVTALTEKFDNVTELSKGIDHVTELSKSIDHVTELSKGIDHVTELTKHINIVTEPTRLEEISESVERESVSYVPIDDTKNEILQTQSTEVHYYESTSTEEDNHIKVNIDSDLETPTETYAEYLSFSITPFDAKCNKVESKCEESSETAATEVTSQHAEVDSENTTEDDEREYQQNTNLGLTDIPHSDYQSHVISYKDKFTTKNVTDEDKTESTAFDKINVTTDNIISSASDEIENESHASFHPTDFHTASDLYHDSSDDTHKVTEATEIHKSVDIFSANSSTTKAATEHTDGSSYTTNTNISSFDEVENIKNELVPSLDSEDISSDSKSSSPSLPEEELETTSEIITSEILYHPTVTINFEGDSSVTDSEIIPDSLKTFSIEDKDSQDKEVLNDSDSEANSDNKIHTTSGLHELPSSSTEYTTTDHSKQNTDIFKLDIASASDEFDEMEGEELSTNILKFETTKNLGETSTVGHTEESNDNVFQITKSGTTSTNKEYDATNDLNDNNDDESSQILVTAVTLEDALLHATNNRENQASHSTSLDEDSYTTSYIKDQSTESVKVELTSAYNSSLILTGMELDSTESSSTSATTYDVDFGTTKIEEPATEVTEKISTVSQSNSPANDSKTESNDVDSPDIQPFENADNNEANEEITLDHNDMLSSKGTELSTESNNSFTDIKEPSQEVTGHRNDILSTKVTEISTDSHLSFETVQKSDSQKFEFALGSPASDTESEDKDVKGTTPSSKATEKYLFSSTFTENTTQEIDILEAEEDESQDTVKSNTTSYDTASVVTLNTGYENNYTSQEEPHGISYTIGATYGDRNSAESTATTDLITKPFEKHATDGYTEIEGNQDVNKTYSIIDENKFVNPSHDIDPDLSLKAVNADDSDAKFSLNTVLEDINELHTASYTTFHLDQSNTGAFEEEMNVSVSSKETVSINTKNSSATTTEANDDKFPTDNENHSTGQDSSAEDIAKIDIHQEDHENAHLIKEKVSPGNSTDEYDVLDAEEDIFHQVSTYKEQQTSLSALELVTSSTEATNAEILTSIKTTAGQTSGTETSAEQTSNAEINAERTPSPAARTEQTSSAEQASSTDSELTTSTKENSEQTSSTETTAEYTLSRQTDGERLSSTEARADQTSSTETSVDQTSDINVNAEHISSTDISTEQTLGPQTRVQFQVVERLSDNETSNTEFFTTDATEISSAKLSTKNSIVSNIEYKIASQAQTNVPISAEKDNNNYEIGETSESEEFDSYEDEEQDSEPISSEDYVEIGKDEKVYKDKVLTVTSDITSEKTEMNQRTTIISILFGRNDYSNYPGEQNAGDFEEYLTTEKSLKETESDKPFTPYIEITTETDSENEESTTEGSRNENIDDIVSNLSPSLRYVTGRNLNTMDDILHQSSILSNSYTQLTSNSNEIQDVVNTEAISQENIMERRKNLDAISIEGKATGSNAQNYLTKLVSPNNTQTIAKISGSKTPEIKTAHDTDAYSAYGYLGGVFITGKSKYSAPTAKLSSSKNITLFLNNTQNESDNNNQLADLNKSTPVTTIDNHAFDRNIDSKKMHEERAEIAVKSHNEAEIYLKNETEIKINNVTDTSANDETENFTPDTTVNITIEHFQIINNGPEKGGEWFEPTVPEIPFRKNIDDSRTDPGPKIVANGNDEEIEHTTSARYSITTDLNDLPLKENRSKVRDDTILSDVSENNVTPYDTKSTFITNGALVNDTETTTILKTLPPLPIYLRDISELKANADKLRINQSEVPQNELPNHEGYTSFSIENYTTVDSVEHKTDIPPHTIIRPVAKSSQAAKEIEKLPSYSMVDVISNVFKAPGYDSEVHARSLNKDKPVFIVKRNAKEPEVSSSTENTEVISTPKVKYSTKDSITMKGALLVGGYGKKSGHFFPVTSSFIIVESPEDNETSKGDWTEVVLSNGSTVKHKNENSGSRK